MSPQRTTTEMPTECGAWSEYCPPRFICENFSHKHSEASVIVRWLDLQGIQCHGVLSSIDNLWRSFEALSRKSTVQNEIQNLDRE